MVRKQSIPINGIIPFWMGRISAEVFEKFNAKLGLFWTILKMGWRLCANNNFSWTLFF